MKVKLLAYTPNPVDIVATAARKCYDSKNTSDEKMLQRLYKTGHLSPFEHISFTFDIDGISRACLAQLTRHRLASFSVRSQRYCDESEVELVKPYKVKENDVADLVWDVTQDAVNDSYSLLKELGVPNEDARSVLTNAHPTTLVMTMNFRELMHFCNERMCTRSQREIFNLAHRMASSVKMAEPMLGDYLVSKCEKHIGYPFCTESKSCGLHPTLQEIYKPLEDK